MSPRVSIGLPVYNGEKFVGDAITCALEQTFEDLELIISDNASTDSTEEICREAASCDDRVRYVRVEQNHGLAWNFGRVVELARGDYFKWAAHDDLFASTFVEHGVRALEDDHRYVLSFSEAFLVDAHGQELSRVTDLLPMDHPDPLVRLRVLLLNGPVRWMWQFGLIRLPILRSIPPWGGYALSDSVLLERLALRGRFHSTPEPLFSFRLHEAQSEALFFDDENRIDNHAHAVYLDPSLTGQLLFPWWRLTREHLSSVTHSGLAPVTKVSGFRLVVRWMARKRAPLGRDLKRAGQELWHQRTRLR